MREISRDDFGGVEAEYGRKHREEDKERERDREIERNIEKQRETGRDR